MLIRVWLFALVALLCTSSAIAQDDNIDVPPEVGSEIAAESPFHDADDVWQRDSFDTPARHRHRRKLHRPPRLQHHYAPLEITVDYDPWDTISWMFNSVERVKTTILDSVPCDPDNMECALWKADFRRQRNLPFDCFVSAWSNFSACTAPCSGGSQLRSRSVLMNAFNGGADCPALIDEQACGVDACSPCVLRRVKLGDDAWTAFESCGSATAIAARVKGIDERFALVSRTTRGVVPPGIEPPKVLRHFFNLARLHQAIGEDVDRMNLFRNILPDLLAPIRRSFFTQYSTSTVARRPLRVFEIGLHCSARSHTQSLAGTTIPLWLEYFAALPFGVRLTHLELDSKCAHIYSDVMSSYASLYSLHQGDQSDVETMEKVLQTEEATFSGKGAFDIVVDNGAASAYAQLSSLVTLFPHMQNRGLYIITDVRTATFVRSLVAQLEHNSKGGNGVAQLPYIADYLSANMSLTDSVADSISQSLAPFVSDVECWHGVCAIRRNSRKATTEVQTKSNEEPVQSSPDFLKITPLQPKIDALVKLLFQASDSSKVEFASSPEDWPHFEDTSVYASSELGISAQQMEFYQSLLSDLRRRFGRSVESESSQTLRILLAGIDCRGISDVLVGPPSNPFSPAALGHRFELISSLLPRLVAFFRPIARHSRLNLVVLADTEQCAELYQNAYDKALESQSKWLSLEFSHIRLDEEYEQMEHGFSGTDIYRSLLELKAHDDRLASAFDIVVDNMFYHSLNGRRFEPNPPSFVGLDQDEPWTQSSLVTRSLSRPTTAAYALNTYFPALKPRGILITHNLICNEPEQFVNFSHDVATGGELHHLSAAYIVQSAFDKMSRHAHQLEQVLSRRRQELNRRLRWQSWGQAQASALPMSWLALPVGNNLASIHCAIGGVCALIKDRKTQTRHENVDCEVDTWTAFSPCSKLCDGGVTIRTRKVTRFPINGGFACPALIEKRTCNVQACSVCAQSFAPVTKDIMDTCQTAERVKHALLDLSTRPVTRTRITLADMLLFNITGEMSELNFSAPFHPLYASLLQPLRDKRADMLRILEIGGLQCHESIGQSIPFWLHMSTATKSVRLTQLEAPGTVSKIFRREMSAVASMYALETVDNMDTVFLNEKFDLIIDYGSVVLPKNALLDLFRSQPVHSVLLMQHAGAGKAMNEFVAYGHSVQPGTSALYSSGTCWQLGLCVLHRADVSLIPQSLAYQKSNDAVGMLFHSLEKGTLPHSLQISAKRRAFLDNLFRAYGYLRSETASPLSNQRHLLSIESDDNSANPDAQQSANVDNSENANTAELTEAPKQIRPLRILHFGLDCSAFEQSTSSDSAVSNQLANSMIVYLMQKFAPHSEPYRSVQLVVVHHNKKCIKAYAQAYHQAFVADGNVSDVYNYVAPTVFRSIKPRTVQMVFRVGQSLDTKWLHVLLKDMNAQDGFRNSAFDVIIESTDPSLRSDAFLSTINVLSHALRNNGILLVESLQSSLQSAFLRSLRQYKLISKDDDELNEAKTMSVLPDGRYQSFFAVAKIMDNLLRSLTDPFMVQQLRTPISALHVSDDTIAMKKQRDVEYEKLQPVDCKVSTWSPFSTCSQSCGSGRQFRTRYVTRLPIAGGAACPAALYHERACNQRDCECDGHECEAKSVSVCDSENVDLQCPIGQTIWIHQAFWSVAPAQPLICPLKEMNVPVNQSLTGFTSWPSPSLVRKRKMLCTRDLTHHVRALCSSSQLNLASHQPAAFQSVHASSSMCAFGPVSVQTMGSTACRQRSQSNQRVLRITYSCGSTLLNSTLNAPYQAEFNPTEAPSSVSPFGIFKPPIKHKLVSKLNSEACTTEESCGCSNFNVFESKPPSQHRVCRPIGICPQNDDSKSCICPAQYAGHQCQRCAPGFLHYPACLPASDFDHLSSGQMLRRTVARQSLRLKNRDAHMQNVSITSSHRYALHHLPQNRVNFQSPLDALKQLDKPAAYSVKEATDIFSKQQTSFRTMRTRGGHPQRPVEASVELIESDEVDEPVPRRMPMFASASESLLAQFSALLGILLFVVGVRHVYRAYSTSSRKQH